MCFYLREVRRLWSEDDKKESSDFVLMTSFPQIRISDMESSLEAAGEFVQHAGYSNSPVQEPSSSGPVSLSLDFCLRLTENEFLACL